MTVNTERRSSDRGIDELETDPAPGDQGVGGRHAPSPSPGRGGGYQGTRGTSKFPAALDPVADIRLEELRQMGIQARWLKIAEAIGVDAFLAMWRILDADLSIRTDKGDLEVTLRPYSSYLRYQRNRYIESLFSQGLSAKEIQKAVQQQLCEVIGIRHITRIGRGT